MRTPEHLRTSNLVIDVLQPALTLMIISYKVLNL